MDNNLIFMDEKLTTLQKEASQLMKSVLEKHAILIERRKEIDREIERLIRESNRSIEFLISKNEQVILYSSDLFDWMRVY